MTTRTRVRATLRGLVTTTTVVALAAVGVVIPTVSLPAPEAHAVAPDVENVRVPGVDREAKAQQGALSAPTGHEDDEDGHEDGALAALSTKTSTDDFLVAGVTWDADTDAEVTEVAVRVREDGAWTDWQSLGIDGDAQDDLDSSSAEFADARAGTEPLVSTGADGIQVRVRTADGSTPPDLQADLVDPGPSAADAAVGDDSRPASSADAGTGMEIRPSIVSRAKWGADESLGSSWPEYSKKLKAMYVHHTAGTNSYKESQSAALVRGIYAYHTKSRGWPDIGYQFLVDKYGNIFQGRRDAHVDNPVGAQAGGYNTGTIGISAMGNFDTAQPTSALLTSISKVVAWKGYLDHVSTKGTVTLTTGGSTGSGTHAKPGTKVTVPTVLMHKTTNQTACPGRYLAAKMGTIRSKAAALKGAAMKKYGTAKSPVAAPTRVTPPSSQVPVQWSSKATYKWKAVKGASYYQVLSRSATFSSDMPSTNNWRMVTSKTTKLSATVTTGANTARQFAVRAVYKDGTRGPMANLVHTVRPIHTNSWKFSSGDWKKVTNTVYAGDMAYATYTGGAKIRLKSANQVRKVVIRGATNPADGKLQVLVGGKVYGTLNFAQPSDGDRTFVVKLPKFGNGDVVLHKINDGKKVRISKIALPRW